jgi:ribosomal protein S1
VDGKVARIASFGAFIELEDGVDGLVHISQVAGRHIEKVEEELKVGQMIKVKITAIDKVQKRISLSKKVADNEIYFDYLDDEGYDGEYDEGYDGEYDDYGYVVNESFPGDYDFRGSSNNSDVF